MHGIAPGVKALQGVGVVARQIDILNCNGLVDRNQAAGAKYAEAGAGRS
ncbi:hypothetical protein [Microbulbifer spongiae]|uniref:Uncharacterized protein n=1 Tax=Microbulbifer spongiae TaxID=2944933 RepID=A0ABY9EIW7_9GAMM|nr:hypothetical protein [Microbulbifer sp. MI-G]WKD51081.1 hypothetical protein M8T91_06565 [Microbulbifer sp. MI-G]